MKQTFTGQIFRTVESVLGCKWMLLVLNHIRNGVQRPKAIERAIPGLTTKVLNERLQKLVRFGLLCKRSYPEVPPRVEYEFTPLGRSLMGILQQLEQLETEYFRDPTQHSAPLSPSRLRSRPRSPRGTS